MNEFVPLLDDRVRDVRKFREKIVKIPLRIIVEGTRGKTSTVRILEEMMRGLGKRTFAKVTGEETPLLIYNGIVIPLYRKNRSVFLDYETIPTILNFDIDAVVVENQAITPYTMRYLHKILKPQHVIVPNIRVDHTETLGTDLEEMVHNFVNNYRVNKDKINVYYSEPLEEVRQIVLPILEEFAANYPEKIKLHIVRIPERLEHIAGIENYCVDSYFIEANFGIKIDEVEYLYPARTLNSSLTINEAEYIRRIADNLKIITNSQGIRYLNLAKVNDPFSFMQAFNYVLGGTNDPVGLVIYSRSDRIGRTELFENVLSGLEKKIGPRIKQIWLAGHNTYHMYNHISPAMQAIAHPVTETDDIGALLSYVKEHDLVLVTMANRVNPFMNELMKQLEEGGAQSSGGMFRYSEITEKKESMVQE